MNSLLKEPTNGTKDLTYIPVVEHGKQSTCGRCGTIVEWDNVSEGYYAYCPTHDEDLFSWEVLC